jgi:recombination protein RecR
MAALVEALRKLPGVGPKSAQRMALHLMVRERSGAQSIIDSLSAALEQVQQCPRTRMFCEASHCGFCHSERLSSPQLCIVESPADLMAIEANTQYKGRYFVLMGRLSPVEGIGPEALGLDQLESLLAEGDIQDIIIATSPTFEGLTTAQMIADMGRKLGLKVSRIAHGVPMGSDLDSVDAGTLSLAFGGRQAV